ncbi:hypothetical protein [Methanosarcina sp. MTP4]|uniref:hypothetical protein n=1 Tax=Methanosarcina sp. MTP4 TaxID=1434100 RepID=UPI0012E064D9|nr:hypothetical protein [Methanosarcina sp. MTP4]
MSKNEGSPFLYEFTGFQWVFGLCLLIVAGVPILQPNPMPTHGCASNRLAPEFNEKDEELKAEAAFFLF